jgi:oligoendopeptidase F
MFSTLPKDSQKFLHLNWEQIKPYADDLAKRSLTSATVTVWLTDWSDLSRMVSEMYARLYVATTVDTTDPVAKQRFNTFLDDVFTHSQAASQVLKEKLLASGLQPEGFEIPLRNMRVEAEIYRENNLSFLAEEKKLANEYDEIIGAQTVEWEGKEVTPTQLRPVYLSTDRSKREKAWRLALGRHLTDRPKANELWVKLMKVRGRIATNAGFPDYRSYRWKELLRFDYTPENCKWSFRQRSEFMRNAESSRVSPPYDRGI